MAVVKPEFPNVPRAQGIPPMPRNNTPTFLENQINVQLGALQAAIWDFISVKEQWSIVDSYGTVITTFDSFVEIEAVNPTTVSNFPVQSGSFASYNKVNLPKPITVVLVKGGSAQEMAKFITIINMVTNSTYLYTVITPTATYNNMNIELSGYRQTAEEGSHLIRAELRMIEVREVLAKYTQTELKNAKTPQSKPVENGGGQQAVTETKGASLLKQGADFAKKAFTQGGSFLKGLF
jgi:hypothetical protein